MMLVLLERASEKGRVSIADAAREPDELMAGFWACFYPVRRPSVREAPTLDPNSVEVNRNQQLDLRNFVALA